LYLQRMQVDLSSVTTLLLSLFGGVLGAAFLFYIRDVWLYSKRTKAQLRRAVVQRKLEKLYSPLFMLVKYQDFIITDNTTKPNLTYISEENKKELDSIIMNYAYLGDDELMRLLPQALGVGFYDERNREVSQHMARLIMSGYEKLRNEYLEQCT